MSHIWFLKQVHYKLTSTPESPIGPIGPIGPGGPGGPLTYNSKKISFVQNFIKIFISYSSFLKICKKIFLHI